MSDDPLPQSDQIEGAPHPKETPTLYGHQTAKDSFLEAFNSGRLHHAWLISGPRGIGKATLAWKIARFLLATPPDDGGMFAPPTPTSLDIDPSHPVHARIVAGSEPGVFSLKRAYDADKKKFKAQITVDEVRKLKGFFGMSATDGGRRVVIVDTADDMNVNAANALLKLLEEPPANALLILISHQPSRLLPTIRSRCRELRCSALDTPDIANALAAADVTEINANAIAQLTGGSVGEAIALINLDGLKLYQGLINLAATFPDFDRSMAIALGETVAARGSEERFAILIRLVDVLLNRLSRTGLGLLQEEALPGEAEVLRKLSPNAHAASKWADIAHQTADRLRHGRAVNLDPSALVLDMVLSMNDTARDLAV